MLENIWTDYLKEQLADQLGEYRSPDPVYPFLPDRWIAMSLLQKAVRRGDIVSALRSGQYLLRVDYRILWRRLVVIAWEDISYGDFDLCGMVTAAAGSKRWRAGVGGKWKVAALLIEDLCKAQKNRLADDLLTIVEHDGVLEDIRDNLGTASMSDLKSVVYGTESPLLHRTIALWYAMGTDKYGSDILYRRSGDVECVFDRFPQELCPEHVLSICRIAVSRSQTVLPAMIALIWDQWRDVKHPTQSSDDTIPAYSDYTIVSIPRYAFDGNTRAGRRYLYQLMETSYDLNSYINSTVPFPDRKALLRKLYFRTQSSLCNNRQVWSLSDQIRAHADRVGFNLSSETIETGKAILTQAMQAHPMTEAHL